VEVAGPLRNAIARFDVESGRVRSPLFLGERGIDSSDKTADIDRLLAAGEGGVWLLQPPYLLHVDPLREEVRSDQIQIGTSESLSVHTGLGKVWVLSAPTLYEIHPGTDEAAVVYELPAPLALTTASVSLGDAVWIGNSDGTLIRLDPSTGAERQVNVGTSIDALAATADGVWLADILLGTLTRVDPETLDEVGEPIAIEGNLDQLVVEGDHVWVLDQQFGGVTLIDGTTSRRRGAARVGGQPTEMAATEDALWVGDRDGWLYRIDATNLAVDRHRVGAEVLGVDVDDADGSVWVYVGDPIAVDGSTQK
jgi:streptogramin lyase